MYRYEDYRSFVFTEEGQPMFLAIRDKAKALISSSGAATMEKIIAGQCGLNWHMLACVDRLVEIGDLRELTNPERIIGQHRTFVRSDHGRL